MKKLIVYGVVFLLIFALVLCAIFALLLIKGRADSTPEAAPDTTLTKAEQKDYIEAKITLNNLYDYFEYYEMKSCFKYNDGSIGALQIAYGLKLKDSYTALNSPEHKDTLKLTFTATGVINKGSYDINYDTLDYSGVTESTEYEAVEQELVFWPKGDRTSVWTFGNYSSMYVMYLTDFNVTAASGTVYLKQAETGPEA